ncbi:P-TEFb-associated cyclin-dependent protein kinase Cdk9 [Parelaphostrongylus tenuis]|uniref:p-TEFb-associated cyclin-dependent protein kinase Cdk9 n=1 Tax=Parelaphostrongylus tenuis TaxID=148309 RepID=A0AAD5QVS3_PARTN|nr:P-TEFb-associated cyclin-dependent protein kinase Cdk9 [Parelaphostrongylus tenuis]
MQQQTTNTTTNAPTSQHSHQPPSSSSTSQHHQQHHHHHARSSHSTTSASQMNGQVQQPQPSPQVSAEEMAEMNRQRSLHYEVNPSLIKYIEEFKFPYISDVSNYEKLLKIGQGTFGEVFKARCKKTGKMVALKKILMENEKEGFPITALREVKMLQQLKHENITDLIEVCSSKASAHNRDRSTFYLVFAFCEHDLAGLLSNSKIKISLVNIKTMMKHLFNGLWKIHRSKILHRDMKAANVLLSRDGILKLADFGLARPFYMGHPRQLYTNRVVTLWYRPPELLLGDRQYTTSIDMWGAGCIMAELWTRSPIMQGDTEQKQLTMICNLCGSIDKNSWEKVSELPLFDRMELPSGQPRILPQRMKAYVKDDLAVSLIDELLALDPSKRLEAEKALDHTFFYTPPYSKDDFKDLMDTVKTSQFEYTAGGGAHANRGRAVGAGQRMPQRPQVSQSGQFHDMIF